MPHQRMKRIVLAIAILTQTACLLELGHPFSPSRVVSVVGTEWVLIELSGQATRFGGWCASGDA